MKVLFLGSNPMESARLRLDREFREIIFICKRIGMAA